MNQRPLALHQVLRFTPRNAKAEIEVVSKKRPEVILRRTRYRGLVIDERALTRAFAWLPRSPTLQAIVLLEGAARLWPHDGSAAVALRPGDAVLLTPSDASMGRFEDASYLDLEWLPVEAPPSGGLIGRLSKVELSRATDLGARLVAPSVPPARSVPAAAGEAPDRALFAEAFALFSAIGAPLGPLDAAKLTSGPSDQDLAIARAIAAQIADLRSAASALSFGEHAQLSPRQLQRILTSYFERYRMNATNWRDMRNRYRIHIAIALLSVPELSIAAIADEVGYASPAALARAFADLDLPPPGGMREELARMAEAP